MAFPSATLLAQAVVSGVFTGALYGLLGLAVVFMNLITDLAYTVADPRTRAG